MCEWCCSAEECVSWTSVYATGVQYGGRGGLFEAGSMNRGWSDSSGGTPCTLRPQKRSSSCGAHKTCKRPRGIDFVRKRLSRRTHAHNGYTWKVESAQECNVVFVVIMAQFWARGWGGRGVEWSCSCLKSPSPALPIVPETGVCGGASGGSRWELVSPACQNSIWDPAGTNQLQ